MLIYYSEENPFIFNIYKSFFSKNEEDDKTPLYK
jgi:hypothetical protein